jgi:hypothetical protein
MTKNCLNRIYKGEMFSAAGKHTDIYSTEEIVLNISHFSIWFYKECIKDGKELFNLDFLGKWRTFTKYNP